MELGIDERIKKAVRKMISKNRRQLNNNGGETMIETLVAFAILVIIFLALSGMVAFSSTLRMRATDTASVFSSFYKEVYKREPDQGKVKPYYYIGKYAEDHTTMFTLKLSEETSQANLSSNTTIDFSQSIRIPCIDATGYTSKESIIDTENLVRPKLLMFKYHKDN